MRLVNLLGRNTDMDKNTIREIVQMGIREGAQAVEDREARKIAMREEARRRNQERCREVARKYIMENLANIIRDGMLAGGNPIEVFHSDDEDEAEAVREALSEFKVNIEHDKEAGYEDDTELLYRVFLTLPTRV